MPEQQSSVLTVRQLKKKIKDRLIIKGISFEVKEGEVFGFLGPNGSGKTTTIRMLVNLIRPTEGEIAICGIPVRERPEEALRHVGCIVENPELYGYLTGWENLEHFARMFPDIGEERIREVVAIVGMDQRIHDKVRTYSLGMRQRLGIAQALLGRPKLLILDEPTNGLDPQGIKEMREFIRELAATGISVFVSSHLLSEIQLMCDRVAIISHGSVIAVGEVSELIRQADALAVWRVSPAAAAREILSAYAPVDDEKTVAVHDAATEAGGAVAGPEDTGPEAFPSAAAEIDTRVPPALIPELNRRLVAAGIDVYAITIKNPTLEELFLRLTEGESIG